MAQHKLLTWTGRITGFLMTIFFLSFFIGEGMPDILKGQGKDLLEFIPFTLVSFIGYIIAWLKPMWGGIMLIAGAILLAFYFYYAGDTWMAILFSLPSLLVGLCFLASVNKEII